VAVIFWIFAPSLAGVFTDDPEVLRILTLYLRIFPAGYAFLGINMLACNELNGIHHPLQSTMLNAIRTLIIFVPLAWLGGRFFGEWGILAGATAANILAGILSELVLELNLPKEDLEKTEAADVPAAELQGSV
jgi:Na+-driven multidrug efflux pump